MMCFEADLVKCGCVCIIARVSEMTCELVPAESSNDSKGGGRGGLATG